VRRRNSEKVYIQRLIRGFEGSFLLQACLNIEAGIEVLALLKASKLGGHDPANWLQHWSTHPNSEARITNLQKVLPAVLHSSPCHYSDELKRSYLSVKNASIVPC
jgi:hypothetical protein